MLLPKFWPSMLIHKTHPYKFYPNMKRNLKENGGSEGMTH